ncbi:MAG: TOBE domain-containing protein, partial [Cypionkella sp.]
VRPEDLIPTSGAGVYTGTVEFTEALGEVTLLYFKRDAGAPQGAAQMVGKLPGIHAGLRHSTVTLSAAPEKVHVFAGGESLLYR